VSDEPPAVRASDSEREQTVAALREHVASGRLTLDEFTHRVDLAYAAQARTELEPLTSDLPATSAEPEPSARRPTRFTGVAFGTVERKGRWRLPRFSALLVVCGDADIDLRAARTDGRVVTITALLLLGNADFYVPEGVDVELGGLTVFGHRREHGRDVEPAPGAPLVRIRVWSLFGTSDVWRLAADARGSFRELIRSVRERARLDAG
jgi:hypothetical protein